MGKLASKAKRASLSLAQRAHSRIRVASGKKGLSIIVPLYNSMPYFKKTVQSILSQDYDLRDVEVLIVDDGSTDGSSDYVDSLAETDSNLFRVFHLLNSGSPSGPRNYGLERAVGEYVFFCDADDYFSERAFGKMMRHAEEWRPDIMLVKTVSPDGRAVAKAPFAKGNIGRASLYEQPVFSLSVFKLFQREFLLENKITFDESLSMREDDLFVAEALFAAKRIAVAADYPYYNLTQRDDKANLTLTSEFDFDRDYPVLQKMLLSAREVGDWDRVCSSKLILPRVFNFAWMGCASAISKMADHDQQKEAFHLLRVETEPYFDAPWTNNLPSSIRMLFSIMEAEDVLSFVDMVRQITVRSDGSFLRCDVLVDDVEQEGGRCFWCKNLAGNAYRLEVDSAKVYRPA